MPPDMYSARVVVSATVRAWSAASRCRRRRADCLLLGEDELDQRSLGTVVLLACQLDSQLQLGDLCLELASLGLGVGQRIGVRGESYRRRCWQVAVAEEVAAVANAAMVVTSARAADVIRRPVMTSGPLCPNP